MNPDTLNLLRGIATALAMLAFVAVAVWAWSHRRREAFDAAALLPLEEDAEIADAAARDARRASRRRQAS